MEVEPYCQVAIVCHCRLLYSFFNQAEDSFMESEILTKCTGSSWTGKVAPYLLENSIGQSISFLFLHLSMPMITRSFRYICSFFTRREERGWQTSEGSRVGVSYLYILHRRSCGRYRFQHCSTAGSKAPGLYRDSTGLDSRAVTVRF